ncbi:hypothetical protein [Conexibacter sp. DBS9H8]|uniref:hypothetical protein n=1 Tax=Conexibacter sp. DBS9H8 TaxID=2937801 RepID=UPI00200C8794|nr:hypothetical protein [Conexibacter sp. DBS9H8]
MPPTDRFIPSFAAEPPQEATPSGRWAETLTSEFLAAVSGIDADGEDLGSPGEIRWFPDRTYAGRTYVPASARTSTGFELFGFVSYTGGDGAEPSDFRAQADFTAETAEENPAWKLDLSDEVIAVWRGEGGARAEITLVWGVPLIRGGALVTAELANLAVDQCEVQAERFTLIAPDNYMGDFLEVKLWGRRGNELAVESLYVEDDEDDGPPEAPEG